MSDNHYPLFLLPSSQTISTEGIITLSGVALLESYQRLLQNLSYALSNDTAEPPCPLNRTIGVTLSGGE